MYNYNSKEIISRSFSYDGNKYDGITKYGHEILNIIIRQATLHTDLDINKNCINRFWERYDTSNLINMANDNCNFRNICRTLINDFIDYLNSKIADIKNGTDISEIDKSIYYSQCSY